MERSEFPLDVKEPGEYGLAASSPPWPQGTTGSSACVLELLALSHCPGSLGPGLGWAPLQLLPAFSQRTDWLQFWPRAILLLPL